MAFHCDLKGELFVRNFVGFEKLGECFEYSVTLYSKKQDLELIKLLGTHATVEVRMDLKKPRFFDGIVCEFSHLGSEETYFLYRVVLRPWLWLLSRSRGSEIFQNMTVVDIARDMFGKGTGDKKITKKRAKERGEFALFDDQRLIVPLPKREYCVQYRESDLDFISRLFEHHGIYYYFTHEKGQHKLVLADGVLSHEADGDFGVIQYNKLDDEKRPDIGQFLEWTTSLQVTSGAVTLRDFDFTKSRAPLEAEKANPKSHPLSKAEIYDYPGGYTEVDPGTRSALVKLQEAQGSHHLVRGVTDSRGLSTGALFILEGHKRKSENRQYLIVSTRYDLDAGSFHSGGATATSITSQITAWPSEVPYAPPRRTPVPFLPGPQSARVVGPKGKEVWTDSFGRVKVQFPWDREGKHDEKSSCMVRVSQGWAGAGWGAWHLPRIGQEVLVDFLDGDIDRPIIVGRVYNDAQERPYDPQLKPSHSGWKTRTIGGTPNDFNELRFDDAKGEEEIFVRAQHDYNAVVQNDRTTDIGNDHKHTVKNNLNVVVSEGEYTTEVETDRMYIHVPKSEFHVVSKQITEDADLDITLLVHGAKIVIDKKSITLTALGSEIKLDPSGVTVTGPMVSINAPMIKLNS